MRLKKLRGKKILILGFGTEGKATLKFLKRKVSKIKVDISDKAMDKNYLDKQKKYDLVIKTPGIPKKNIFIPYTTATNIFFANTKNRTIGVTGSKGKSTTASLIFWILKQAGIRAHLIGNIGKPMLEELLKPVRPDDIFVLELSSYQLDDIQYSPHISVILNIFPEHMDYHDGVTNYYRAKKNIIANVKKNDYFIYNPLYKELRQLAKTVVCKSIRFVKKVPINSNEIPLLGSHNLDNIRAAVTVARLLNIPDEKIKHAIKSFKALPHRLEFVGTYRGIKFYDDAISTTPESTIAAIKTLKNIGTLFLGGKNRGYDFSNLVDLIKTYQIKNLVLFPDSGKEILELLRSKNHHMPKVYQTDNMENAIKFAFKNTPKGKICLLSTASPSYSLWKNFEEKGEQFQFFVKKYKIPRS